MGGAPDQHRNCSQRMVIQTLVWDSVQPYRLGCTVCDAGARPRSVSSGAPGRARDRTRPGLFPRKHRQRVSVFVAGRSGAARAGRDGISRRRSADGFIGEETSKTSRGRLPSPEGKRTAVCVMARKRIDWADTYKSGWKQSGEQGGNLPVVSRGRDCCPRAPSGGCPLGLPGGGESSVVERCGNDVIKTVVRKNECCGAWQSGFRRLLFGCVRAKQII